MSLSQLHYFVAVAEEGHVGRAAQRLSVAQPAVSRQIRALEDEIGTSLFTRAPRGMTRLASGRFWSGNARFSRRWRMRRVLRGRKELRSWLARQPGIGR